MAFSSGFWAKSCRNQSKNSYHLPKRCRSGPELTNWYLHRCVWFFSVLCARVGRVIWKGGREIILTGRWFSFLSISCFSRFFRASKVYYCCTIALLTSRPTVLPESLTGHPTALKRRAAVIPPYISIWIHLCNQINTRRCLESGISLLFRSKPRITPVLHITRWPKL